MITNDTVKEQILLCYVNQDEKLLNVTNLAKTLGIEKYVVSRAMSDLEKSGMMDRSNPRKPFLTNLGLIKAREYDHKINAVTDILFQKGDTYDGMQEDASLMAFKLNDETLNRIGVCQNLLKRKITRKIIEGYKLPTYLQEGYYNGNFELTYINNNGEFETLDGTCNIKIKNNNGMVYMDRKVINTTISEPIEHIYYENLGENTGHIGINGSMVFIPLEFITFTHMDQSSIFLGKIKLLLDGRKKHVKASMNIFFKY